MDHRISQFQTQQAVNNLLNFENKLEKDLQATTGSLINRMKDHALLRREGDAAGGTASPVVPSFESKLVDCLAKMKNQFIPNNKNYYAMSLKLFFQTLTEDELEFLCHNYVHNWINDEILKSNRLLSKYQVE